MVRSVRSFVRKSSWSQTPPTSRLLVGVLLIAGVGFLGLTPHTAFDIKLIWPHAALWGAVGWASVGLSLRPMLFLCAFGFAQDIAFNSPIAVFMIVNLATYGVAASFSGMFDVDTDPVKGLIVAAIAMAVGFFLLWVLASGTVDYVIPLTPLLQAWFVTLLLYLPIATLFQLGGVPGERAMNS